MTKCEITSAGKSDYFTGIGFKGWMVRHFIQPMGVTPMGRSGGRTPQAALNKGLEVLRRGDLFGTYPEGTRPPDGRLCCGKTGIARLALESGAPTIPVAMVGTNKSQLIDERLLRPERIGVIVSRPLDSSRYTGMENDRFALRSIADETMYALMLLSGQGYADEYAANVKKKLEEAKKASKDASQKQA